MAPEVEHGFGTGLRAQLQRKQAEPDVAPEPEPALLEAVPDEGEYEYDLGQREFDLEPAHVLAIRNSHSRKA